jgi:hypothetical protein
MGVDSAGHRRSGNPNQGLPSRISNLQDVSARAELLQLILLPFTGALGQLTKGGWDDAEADPWAVQRMSI